MKKYRLDLILQAASFFATEDGVVDNLAYDIKTIQSLKDGGSIEDVEEIDEETLTEAMSKHTRCVKQVVDSILSRYEEIRTAD